MSAATGVQRQTCGNCHGARVVGAFPCAVCGGLGQVAVATKQSAPTEPAGVIALHATGQGDTPTSDAVRLDTLRAAFEVLGSPLLITNAAGLAAARASEASEDTKLLDWWSEHPEDVRYVRSNPTVPPYPRYHVLGGGKYQTLREAIRAARQRAAASDGEASDAK